MIKIPNTCQSKIKEGCEKKSYEMAWVKLARTEKMLDFLYN